MKIPQLIIISILFMLCLMTIPSESISLADRIREHRLNATVPPMGGGVIYDIPCFGSKWVQDVSIDNHLFTYLSLLIRPLCRRYSNLCTRTPEGEEERRLILSHIAKYNGVDLNLALLISDRFEEINMHTTHPTPPSTGVPEDDDLHYDEEVFRIALIYNHLTRNEARFIKEFLEKERKSEESLKANQPATHPTVATVTSTTSHPDIPSRHLLLHARRTDVDPKCISDTFNGIFLRVYEQDKRTVAEKRAVLRDHMNFVIESQIKELIEKLRETADLVESNYDNIVDNRTHVCDNFMKEYGVYPITMLDSMVELIDVLSSMVEEGVHSNVVPTPVLPSIISQPASGTGTSSSDSSSSSSSSPTATGVSG